jgi:hypothetical protein
MDVLANSSRVHIIRTHYSTSRTEQEVVVVLVRVVVVVLGLLSNRRSALSKRSGSCLVSQGLLGAKS